MLNYIDKNIVTVEKGVIGHGVNCQGAMGAGIAAAIRNAWPTVYQLYKSNPTGEPMLGHTHIVQVKERNLFVANCYTQVYCGSDGQRYADSAAVEKCMEDVISWARTYLLDVYVPRIGCGLGGLDWETEVKPIYEKISQENPEINIFVCEWPPKKKENKNDESNGDG